MWGCKAIVSQRCWWTWVLDCSWVSAISARLDRPNAAHSAAAFISARQFCRSARLCTLWRLVRELLVFRGAYYSRPVTNFVQLFYFTV